MARPKKKPEYDSDQVAQQIMEAVTDAYLNPPQGTEDDTGHMQLKQLAEEFSMTPLKVRKLLVVNDKLNGSTTLDIQPYRRYVVEKAAAGFSRLPPRINFALFAP